MEIGPALSINGHGFIAGTSQAADVTYPGFAETVDRIGRERGWPPLSRAQFEASRGPRGATFVGSPAEIVDKILFQHEVFGHDRTTLQLTVGPTPHRDVLRAIELLGTEGAPAVRKAIGTPARSPMT